MLRPAQTGRLLRRSLRTSSFQSFYSLRASQSSIQPKLAPSSSIITRTFASYPRFLQQATAEVEDDEIRHTTPELQKFSELANGGIIHPKIVDNITKMGIHTMTDVQRLTINECLDGSDVIAQAKTGTGKTIAFLMPIIQRLMRDRTLTGLRPAITDTRAVIISPTRELAEQIGAEARKVCANTHVQIQTAVGGTAKRQNLMDMRRFGCHILIATPGRLKDLLSDPASGVTLNHLSTFVLDEADRLLDIGFAPDIAEIQSYMPPRSEKERQTLMFSATVPKSVVDLVRQTLRPDFKFIRGVDPNEQATHESIPQHVLFLPGLQNQIPVIAEIASTAIEAHRQDPENNLPFKAIVFYGSKNEVTLSKQWLQAIGSSSSSMGSSGINPLGRCRVLEMSAALTQSSRTYNSNMFRHAESAILVASDVVARGMDFPNVSHVIQVGLPQTTEAYIHRIGRTGRAGKKGQGYLLLQQDDRREFEQNIGRELNLKEDNSLHTANLDMTRGAQLPLNVATLMQYVEKGVRAIPYDLKESTYLSMIGVIKQQTTRRSGQKIVDMMNDLSKYGWGLEKSPGVGSSWAAKMGLSNCEGLEISQGGYRGREGGFGQQYGGDRGRGGSFDDRDPFGKMGVTRGFPGDDRRGGGAGRGFGGDDRRGGGSSRGFGGDDRGRGGRGSGGDDRRGGFGGDNRGRGGVFA